MTATIVLAGGTGNLGGRIAQALVARGAHVRALVRPGSASAVLRDTGIEVVPVDFSDAEAMRAACEGGDCVVSALNGLEDVTVTAQGQLLDAAVAAGVPRFIPSDFSIDYTLLRPGENRNFDLRRRFRARLDAAPIAATSIFNGAFAELLNGQAPIVLRKIRRVLYWGSADTRFDVTTMDDTAAFTAAAALDSESPRDLHIAGDRVNARDLATIMSDLAGKRFRTLRAGPLGRLRTLIHLMQRVHPQKDEVFPIWQGMQYLLAMFDGSASDVALDNARYPGLRFTTAREVLANPA